MAKNYENIKINVGNETYVLSDVLNKVTKILAKDVSELFTKLNLTFPRELRIGVLRDVFREAVIKTRQERNTLADEMNYRLSWFNQYTETQLINLFKFYKNQDLEDAYLNEFWHRLILDLVNVKKINLVDFKELLSLSNKKNQREDLIKYNNELNDLFFDAEEQIDGLTLERIRPVLFKSSTIVEIRELGKKYQVNVPSRLKKAELLEIIISELKEDGRYTEELEANLKQLNILLLQRFAKDNGIKASTELKKEEVIEYVLANAQQTKAAYYVPQTTEYEMEARDLGDSIEDEEPIEEPVEEVVEEVVEEAVEEVVEEPVEEKPQPPVVVTERVVQAVQPVNQFDPSTVDGTVLNTVTFGNIKPKQFVEIASVERGFHREEEVAALEVEAEQATPKKRKRSVLKIVFKVILIILIVIINLAIILGIYAVFTPNGAPSGFFQSVENVLNSLTGSFNFFEWIREFVNGLLQ